MALDGKTPSEVAGINLNLGDNKWKGLIEKAVKDGVKKPERLGDKEKIDYWF
jgi:hypothetical protein